MAEEQQDVETLKRRGRRRLVGAVAIVLAAVIVLPMVFDPEPRSGGSTVSVRIPGEDESPFAPKLVTKKPEPAPPPVQKAEAPKKEPPKAPPKAQPKEQYIVQVGVFANPQAALAKLNAARLPYYTEPQGNLTRVRAGPFASREAAERALQQLKTLGLQPGAVAPKSG
jgi:DedD protein